MLGMLPLLHFVILCSFYQENFQLNFLKLSLDNANNDIYITCTVCIKGSCDKRCK